jgi:hypothetical protein
MAVALPARCPGFKCRHLKAAPNPIFRMRWRWRGAGKNVSDVLQDVLVVAVERDGFGW